MWQPTAKIKDSCRRSQLLPAALFYRSETSLSFLIQLDFLSGVKLFIISSVYMFVVQTYWFEAPAVHHSLLSACCVCVCVCPFF